MKEEYLEIEEVEYAQPYEEPFVHPHQPPEHDTEYDDALLRKLLKKFQMTFLFPFLKAADITYRSLRFLSVDDINTAIRSVGHRAEFREKLFTWRRKRYRTNDVVIECDRTTSAPTVAPPSSSPPQQRTTTLATAATANSSQTVSKVQKRCSSSIEPTVDDIVAELPNDSSQPSEPKKAKKNEATVELRATRLNMHLNIEELLDESLYGPVMKAFYKKNGFLERKHRDELIQTIIDYVVTNEIKLHCSDFASITDMIINIFPSEEEAKDYYFINRKGRRNPMGRLYTKYYNTLKRFRVKELPQEGSSCMRSDDKNQNSEMELMEEELQDILQLDESSASAIKNFLRCDDIDWEDVRAMWSKTYMPRQEDIEEMTTKEVLQQWPKYLMAKGAELFNIDFKLKYPQKGEMLRRKWAAFEAKIYNYYQVNIKDEICKGLFAFCKSKPGKDVEDYLLAVLLNAIMQPTARYRDTDSNRRKISIVDAVEWFVIRVSSLNELEQRREELVLKYGDMNSECSPNIVVVGDSNVNVQEVYVHFDAALYEMPDFLSAIDTCMKIFRVLSIPYPTAIEYPWTFIQRYFYEIHLPDDAKCPSMSSLITFMKF